MKDQQDKQIGWGSTKIQYVIMTDSGGVQWKVPTHIDEKPCEYLEKYNPEREKGCFLKVTDIIPK